MEINFKQALAWVRISEGGNDDDKDDSGGRTSRGIEQREWDAYCLMAGLPEGDVWKAPDGAIDDIYHRSYWNPYCPTLPSGIDYEFFDECVNAGPRAAIEMLQVGLGFIGHGVDGHFGIITSAALVKADFPTLIDRMAEYRKHYYKLIEFRRPVTRKYDKGWMARVDFARENAHKLLQIS